MSTGGEGAPDEPPADKPPHYLRAELYVDEDIFYPATLGPTLAQLREKAAKGELEALDVAGYLAVEKAKAMRGQAEVSITFTFDVLDFTAEQLVGPQTWARTQNKARTKTAQVRNQAIQRLANERYPDLRVDARAIANAFRKEALPEPDSDSAIRDLLWVPDEDKGGVKRGAYKLMEEDTLRKIIAKGRPRK